MQFNDMFLAMAGGQSGNGGQGAGWEMLVIFGSLFAMMYFLVIRPQKKRDRERQEMLKRIKVGDKVRTIGGILGTVTSVNEKTIVVRVAEKTDIEFVRGAVENIGDTAKEASPAEKK